MCFILGTQLVVTDYEVQVISRRDFLPFGEEITPDIGARASVAAYQPANDNVKQKFTGYQKDDETGLDFAEARMYENRHGRFTAVDPLLASGKSANPQTFNRFGYVLNNPLMLTDPDGLQAGFWGFNKIPDGYEFTYFKSEEQFADYNDRYINTDFAKQNGRQRMEKWTRGSYIPTGFREITVLPESGSKPFKVSILGDIGTDEQWQNLNVDWYSGNDLPGWIPKAVENSLAGPPNGIVNTIVGIGGILERVTGDNFDLTAGNARQTLDSPFFQAAAISGAANFGFSSPRISPKPLGVANEAGLAPTSLRVSRTPSQLGHIFSSEAGHIQPITSASQGRFINLFERVANSPNNLNPNVLNNFQRVNQGFQGFSQTFRNGQVWTQTYNGRIINAGVNRIPR